MKAQGETNPALHPLDIVGRLFEKSFGHVAFLKSFEIAYNGSVAITRNVLIFCYAVKILYRSLQLLTFA
jgi:hypothetical protein